MNAIQRSHKELRDYQKNAVEYMEKYNSLLLYHKMGTGKTLTSVTVSQAYLDRYPTHRVIVVSPATLLDNFKKEMYTSYVNIRHKDRYEFYSIQKLTNLLKEGLVDCTYSLVIIDEVHNYRTLVKEQKNKIVSGIHVHYMKSFLMNAHKVLLLSGTPVYNSIRDLENIRTFMKTDDLRSKISYHSYEKDDINFPLRIDRPAFIEMSPTYRNQYNRIVQEIYENPDTARYMSLQIFNTDDPRRLQKFATAIRRATQNLESDVKHNKKLEYVLNLVEQVKEKNRNKSREDKYKLLIYSNYKRHGIELVKNLVPPGIRFDTISGDTDMKKRHELVSLYNQGEIELLFLTKAAGEGLDLKGTDMIVIMEPNWNENGIEQVIARAIRFQSHIHREPKRRKVRVVQVYHIKPEDTNPEYMRRMANEMETLKNNDIYSNSFCINGNENSIDEVMRVYSQKKQIILKKTEKILNEQSIERNPWPVQQIESTTVSQTMVRLNKPKPPRVKKEQERKKREYKKVSERKRLELFRKKLKKRIK